ncbi:MAG: tetratricopeptide repeat protein, partial [Verrucomicrobiales bacterium]
MTPLPPLPAAELTLTETFRLDSEGENSSVEQVLRATNWLADEMRESVARDGRSSFIKAHIEELQHQFPSLKADAESVILREDPEKDAIEMRGRYLLPTWGRPGERPQAEFRYRANGLFLAVDGIDPPEERTVARALRHPMRVQHLIQVESKFIRQTEPAKRRQTGPGFRYSCDVIWKQGRVTFDHVWETTAPRVEASEWLEYCRARDDAFAQLEATVLTQPTRPSFVNVRSAVFFLLIAMGVAGGLAVFGKITGLGPWQAKDQLPSLESVQIPEPPVVPPVVSPEVQAEVQIAMDAVAKGDFTSAEPLLEKQQDQYQENAAFQFVRAEIAIRMGQFDRARKALEQAKALEPSNVNGDLLTALLRRTEGDRSGAKQILADAVERNPIDPRPLRELAITLSEQGDTKGACDAWARVLELTPTDP